MRLAILLSLLLSLFGLLLFLGGIVYAQSSTPTPTPTPTSWWAVVDTPTPYNAPAYSDYSCPTGLPYGWGTVTPSTDWLLSCYRCLWTPTPTPTLTATATFLPGTPSPTPAPPTPTPSPTARPTATPSYGVVQFREDVLPDCSNAIYLYDRTVTTNGVGAKWPSIDGRVYGCGADPRAGVLQYSVDIYYNNPYGGSVCLGFGVTDNPGQPIGCISAGSYHFEGYYQLVPGGYYWPGKRMQVYAYDMNIPCNWCDSLSYTMRLVVQSLSGLPTPTPTPVATPSSYCGVVYGDEPNLSDYFGFQGVVITGESCFTYPDDVSGIPIFGRNLSFRLCLDDVRVGELRVAGYVVHLHYILLSLLAVAIVRIFIRA